MSGIPAPNTRDGIPYERTNGPGGTPVLDEPADGYPDLGVGRFIDPQGRALVTCGSIVLGPLVGIVPALQRCLDEDQRTIDRAAKVLVSPGIERMHGQGEGSS